MTAQIAEVISRRHVNDFKAKLVEQREAALKDRLGAEGLQVCLPPKSDGWGYFFAIEKNKSDMKGLCPGLTHVERIPQDRPWEHLFGKHCSIRQREGILTGMNTLVNMHADVISFQTCSYGYKVDSDLNTKVGHQLCQLLLLVG